MPPDRAAALVSATVEVFEADLDGLVAEMIEAAAAAAPEMFSDLALEESVRASVQAMTLRWVDAERSRPGDPVPVDVPPAALDIARDLVRHGVDLQALFTGYRAAENVGCHWWVRAAAVAVPSEELAYIVDFGLAAINAWVGGALERIIDQVERERDDLLGGALARRLEVVTLIVDGAPINEDLARQRLGYDLAPWHTGLVMASRSADHEQGLLENAAMALARDLGVRPPLILPASTTTSWVWLSSSEEPIGARSIRDALTATDDLMVAVGSSASGMAGFRRTHREAVAARRFAARHPRRERVTAFEDVRIALLASQDEEAANQFVVDTLGELAGADPVLWETLRVYLQEDANTARAASRLFTHRNTVLNRMDRAQQLLPHPLEGRRLSVGLALELLRVTGDPAARGERTTPGASH